MGTTLTKPVLLDETGQAIVEKLDEIKDAIDSGGSEKYPVLIHITTPPTKTSYIAGEQLNLAGMVVKAVFSNNVEYDVTDQCTFSPANGTVLDGSEEYVTATYTWHPTSTSFTATQNISVAVPTGISVDTPPTKTDYILNETLDLTGIVVKMNFSNKPSEIVTDSCVFSPAEGTVLDDDSLTSINISYEYYGTTYTATQSINVVFPVYGVEWDGTASSKWTRTGLAANFDDPNPYYGNMADTPSSPFDNILPWSGMERYTRYFGSSPSPCVFVKIPKFYYRITDDPLKIEISMQKLDGFQISPAHADRGDGSGERDYVYVGAGLVDTTSRPEESSAVKVGYTRAQFRSSIHNYDSNLWQWDYAMYATIAMLYLVEFADWNSQAVIGQGGFDSSYSQNIVTLPYHTGTDAATRATAGGVVYRNISHLWSMVNEYIDGIYLNSNNKYCIITNPTNFSDSANGTECGDRVRIRGGIKKFTQSSVFDYFLIPSQDVSFNGNEYICDFSYIISASEFGVSSVSFFQGYTQSGDYTGLFSVSTVSSASAVNNTVSARAMYLP